MLWGSSRPGRGAEEFLVADLQRGRSRPSRAEGRGGGRRAGTGGRRRVGPVACARPCRAAPAPREAEWLRGAGARVSGPAGSPGACRARLARARAARPLCSRASHAWPALPAGAGDSNGPSAAGQVARGRGDLPPAVRRPARLPGRGGSSGRAAFPERESD